MRKVFFVSMIILCSLSSLADEPFRKHRFDSWRALTLPDHAIVFVGNSITDMHPWTEAFGNDVRIVNRGCSGAVSVELMEHIDLWMNQKTDKIFLMIGTNDLGWDSTVNSVARHVEEMVEGIRRRNSEVEIYIESILPARDQRNRSLASIKEANELLRALAEEREGVVYVDLFEPLMGILDGEPFSLDQLHLEALGYKVWCEKIAPYVGVPCRYPATTMEGQLTGGMQAANGMRATDFSVLPTEKEDILFLGDELVKCGEWNELLGNGHIKNRGTGWGYGGNIATTLRMAEVCLNGAVKGERVIPKRIIVYTGTEDVARSGKELAIVEEEYRAMISRIGELAPGCPIVVMGMIPQSNDGGRIDAFNHWLEGMATGNERLTYVALPKRLSDRKGNPRKGYVEDDYLYHKGYEAIARAIAPYTW